MKKLKEFKLNLHVDPNVPLVAQTLRCVPFALRDSVTGKIDRVSEGRHHRASIRSMQVPLLKRDLSTK